MIVAIVSIVMLYIFIQGINFPIVANDASIYAFNGKHLCQERNLANYPMVINKKTGASLPVHHPPGLPLMYTWFYLLQGDTDSDILPRTVAPMYALYLIILLWIILRTRKNKYCSAFGILLMALTPLFIQQSSGNTVDPVRIFLIFLSLICLVRFIESESFILFLLTGIITGSCIYIHSGSVLAVAVIIALYLLLYFLFSGKSIKRRLFFTFLLVLVIGGGIYGAKHTRLGHTIEPAYLSLSALKPPEPSHFVKIAHFGKRRAEISREPGRRLKRIFYERCQVFSTPKFFGLSYYIFLLALFYWIRYIHKKRLDIILLLGAILYGVPVIYKYWINNRYIFTIHPVIAYFGGLAIGSVYGRLRNNRLRRLWPVVLVPLIVIIGWHAPNSMFNENYVKFGPIKKVAKYMFANQKEKFRNSNEILQAIEFINTQTPGDSIVLMFRRAEYFYHSERKGIWYCDQRLKAFYRLRNTEKAYRYLLNLGIDYIMVDPRYEQCRAFEGSELKNILKDEKMSKLVYENWAMVYEIKNETDI